MNHARKPQHPGYLRIMPRLEPMAVPMARYQRRRRVWREAWQALALLASMAALWCGLALDSDVMAIGGMGLCGLAAFASYKMSERG